MQRDGTQQRLGGEKGGGETRRQQKRGGGMSWKEAATEHSAAWNGERHKIGELRRGFGVVFSVCIYK